MSGFGRFFLAWKSTGPRELLNNQIMNYSIIPKWQLLATLAVTISLGIYYFAR